MLIGSNERIPITSHHHSDTADLSKVTLKPVIGNCAMIQFSSISLLSNTLYILKPFPSSLYGYMSKVSNNEVLPKSIVTMLPIDNLYAADMNTLCSLLSFISDQCRKPNIVDPPALTVGQPV